MFAVGQLRCRRAKDKSDKHQSAHQNDRRSDMNPARSDVNPEHAFRLSKSKGMGWPEDLSFVSGHLSMKKGINRWSLAIGYLSLHRVKLVFPMINNQ
jgi:hypothetical protein